MSLFRFHVFAALVACSSLWLAGCQSRNYQAGARAADGIDDAAEHVAETQAELTASVSALNTLLAKPHGDLRKPYRAFDDAVRDLADLTADLNQAADRMALRNSSYLSQWEQEIATMAKREIRVASERRRAKVVRQLEVVAKSFQQAQRELAPVVSDLQDIRKALASDLTLAGIESIRSAAGDAARGAKPVSKTLDKLTAELNALSTALKPEGPTARQ